MVQKKKVKEEEARKNKKVSKVVESVGVKKEKKVFDLPGQKRDPPEEVSSVVFLFFYFILNCY